MENTHAHMLALAQEIEAMLAPHCHRIEIAGSIRRLKAHPRDIEIVCIPLPYSPAAPPSLFPSPPTGIAAVLDGDGTPFTIVKGHLPCKYTQRIYKGVKVDIFFAVPENWGYILTIRTGSAEYAQRLATLWVRKGYKGADGMLHGSRGPVTIAEEADLFYRLGIPMPAPQDRI